MLGRIPRPSPDPLLPAGLRIYAIGDIHGRFDLLQALAAEIRRDIGSAPAQTVEIYLGDYVDRGPQSRDVVEWLIASEPICRRRICLIGNHEEMLLAARSDVFAMQNWLLNGGSQTLASYGMEVGSCGSFAALEAAQKALAAAVPPAHFDFLAGLSRRAEQGRYLFVHAGIRPGVALSDQDPQDLVWIREPFLSSRADFGRIVVHGHSPAEEPEQLPNRINVDTGAFLTGILTCAVLEGSEQRFLQVREREA